MSERTSVRLPFGLDWADALLGAIAVLTLGSLALSLDWPLQHDAPLLHYVAWSMDRFGALPYRDLFETSMPGTFAFHWLVGTLFGWGDMGFRVADLLLLALQATATIRLVQPFGGKPAVAAVMITTVCYLWLGPDMTLQRDHIGLILVVWAVVLGTSTSGPAGVGRRLLIGLLFGTAALFKPHLVIGLGPLAWYLLWWRRQPWPGLAVIAAAAALPGLLALAVLAGSGALPAFLEMVTQYLPLHLGLSGEHQPISGLARLSYLVMTTLFMRGLFVGIPAAIAGFFVAIRATAVDDERRARLVLLAALAGVYLFYPSFAGQFFFYHWAPFQYFLLVMTSLVFAGTTVDGQEAQRWGVGFCALAMAVVLTRPNIIMVEQVRTGQPLPPKEGAVDRMEAALRRTLQPGDRVQPLDWTGGAIHAMLRVEARLATRFLYDYHFYHHMDQPFIATLRGRFMAELQQSAPRLILDVKAKPRVSGANTTDRFLDLERLLKSDYRVVVDDPAFRLLQRK